MRARRIRNPDQTYDLLAVLFDFRHTGVINDCWEYALSLCARADIGPDGTAEERRQVRRLHDPMFKSLIARTQTGSIPGSTEIRESRAMHH